MRRYSAHLGYLFMDLPLEERFAAAANAGFSDVEHPEPYAFGDTAREEKGLACLPDRRHEFRESVTQGPDHARKAGSRFVHAMAGMRPTGAAVDEVWPTYIANLRQACGAVAAVGLPEPCAETGGLLVSVKRRNQVGMAIPAEPF